MKKTYIAPETKIYGVNVTDMVCASPNGSVGMSESGGNAATMGSKRGGLSSWEDDNEEDY